MTWWPRRRTGRGPGEVHAQITGSATALSSGHNVLVGAVHVLPGLFLNPEVTTGRP
jgi:hypothetical protein